MSNHPETKATLEVCMFGGASSLPILAAAELGIFEAAGLDVNIHLTRGSAELMEGLLDGTYDIVHAAPGNFIAWRDRTAAPITAWLGGTSGPIRLIAARDVTELAGLAGREIAVDAVTSGFVSILRKMLRSAGLREEDVDLVPLGATSLRFDALMAGETSASMLTLPWSIQAARSGLQVIGDQEDVLPRLQGSCAASLEGWLDANGATADAYVRAISASLTWLNDARNAGDATALVVKHYDVASDIADEVRTAIMDPRTGWPPSGMIDPVGMEMVCELRTENGQPPAHPAEEYYTLEPYRRVFGFSLLD
jgi:ABC-type nitrate/sulfonate/bicarbonate transport system substrate-binding protein